MRQKLLSKNGECLTCFALFKCFPKTEDRYEPFLKGLLQLTSYNIVRIAEYAPAFTMSDQNMGAPYLSIHIHIETAPVYVLCLHTNRPEPPL